ncbi:MAG: hypothetical protein KDB53_19135 [Planctomycetes bacterium]|nr:hypothetical protein [Planctomycetota bacterium]
MNQYVVVSLYTDGQGLRRDEFGLLREKLTGSVSNPTYVVLDPWSPDEPMVVFDYNDALADDFPKKLDKARRRFQRRHPAAGQLQAVAEK